MAIDEIQSGASGYSVSFNFGQIGNFQITGTGAPNGTEEEQDAAFQVMVNHVATWPEATFVTGGKNFNTIYQITPDPV